MLNELFKVIVNYYFSEVDHNKKDEKRPKLMILIQFMAYMRRFIDFPFTKK